MQSCREGVDLKRTEGVHVCANGPLTLVKACDCMHANTKDALSSTVPCTAQIGLNGGVTQACTLACTALTLFNLLNIYTGDFTTGTQPVLLLLPYLIYRTLAGNHFGTASL